MNIPLKDFLDIVTYNGLFHYVTLPHSIGVEINKDFPSRYCYVDFNSDDTCTVWYPTQAWIDECKRRSGIEQIIADHNAELATRPKKLSQEVLAQQLLQAVVSGNTAESERIIKLIDENK